MRSDEGGPRTGKGIEDQVAAIGAIKERVHNQRQRLDGGMRLKVLLAALTESVSPGILLDIRPVTALLSESEVIHVAPCPCLEGKDQLVGAAIEGAHPGIGLLPNDEVLEFGVDAVCRIEDLSLMAPVHALKMD
jgi:hypothetical protein